MSSSPLRTLHASRFGRASILRTLAGWPASILLHRRSARFAADRPQPVIFAFDHIGHHINLHGRYEARELQTFMEWLNLIPGAADGTALDLGANIGNHSLFFAQHFKRVISFEPNPRTFKVLSLNAELVDNMRCLNLGLSSREGVARLRTSRTNTGGSSLTTEPSGEFADVQLKTLDSVVPAGENVKLIKIDVEGHEHEALLGARETLLAHRPIVLFEQHSDDFVGGRSPVVELLKSYGYARFASIESRPTWPFRAGGAARSAYLLLARLARGETLEVLERARFEPRFYSFLIAIPDWVGAAD